MAEIRYNENGSITISVNGKEETFEQVSKLVNYLRENNLEISLEEIKTIDRQLFEDFDLREYFCSLNKSIEMLSAEADMTPATTNKILDKQNVQMKLLLKLLERMNLSLLLQNKDNKEIKLSSFTQWGEFLKRERIKKGLSQKSLSQKLNLTPNTIKYTETKLIPSLQTFRKICNELEIKIYIQSK